MVPQQEVSVCGPGDTRHTVGGQQIGCFGMLVMWFMFRSGRHVAMSCGHVMWSCHVVMFRKQEKVRERRKSLISRNRGFRAEFRKSVRYRYTGCLLCVVSVQCLLCAAS